MWINYQCEYSAFPIFLLDIPSLWPSIHTHSAWGYYSHQLSKIKISLFIFYFFFCFLFSAYSGEDGFMEALVPVEEITTPASFPGDSNSMQVKIVPTNKSPAGTPARTKGKGKWKRNYTFSNLEHSPIPVHICPRSQHFSWICSIKLFCYLNLEIAYNRGCITLTALERAAPCQLTRKP